MGAPFFAFVNAKGGSGATTVCAELAKSLRHGRKVLAVDGDLSGRRNLAIVLDAVRALDAKREGNKRIGIVDVNGLSVVEMAPSFDSVFTINKDEVESLASSYWDETNIGLLDIPIPFAAPVRAFVVRTTRFIVVAEPTLLGIASAGTMIGELKNFGIPLTRILLLTNARDGQTAVTKIEIERVLGIKVIAELPPMTDRTYGKALSLLEKTLLQIAAEPEMDGVFPSAKGLPQDRRWSGSRGGSEQAGGGETSDDDAPKAEQHSDSHEKLKLLIH